MPAPGPDHRRTTCRRWGLCVPRSGTHGSECNASREDFPCQLFDGGGAPAHASCGPGRRGTIDPARVPSVRLGWGRPAPNVDPILVEEIARRLDEPEALEALFRRDPEPFRAALGAVASAHPDSLVVRVWKARLDAEVVPPSARKSDAGVDVALVVVLSVIATIAARWPYLMVLQSARAYYAACGGRLVTVPLAVYLLVTAGRSWSSASCCSSAGFSSRGSRTASSASTASTSSTGTAVTSSSGACSLHPWWRRTSSAPGERAWRRGSPCPSCRSSW